MHPAIVGKKALPALDLSQLYWPWLEAILRAADIVMGFSPPAGDPEVWAALDFARTHHAMTFALPGHDGDYAVASSTRHPFIH